MNMAGINIMLKRWAMGSGHALWARGGKIVKQGTHRKVFGSPGKVFTSPGKF